MDERDERKRTSGDASKRFRRHQNWSCTTAPGRVWRKPTYWPRGARCIGGMTLVRALVRNFRTCPAMRTEEHNSDVQAACNHVCRRLLDRIPGYAQGLASVTD